VTTLGPAVDLDVRPMSGSIGAEIRGVDLRSASDAEIAHIRRVWLDRKVVFFPDQHLDPTTHLAFAARMGTPTEGHPVLPPMDEHPHIHQIDYAQPRKVAGAAPANRGLVWHADVTFMARPSMATILRAVVIPPAGGDTMWADQRAAFEALSPTMREFCGTLTAVHDARYAFSSTLAEIGHGSWDGEEVTELTPVAHPVVCTHPETGARSLFVNPMFTSHIVELAPAESDVLLAYLYRHSTQPEFTVRYHWRAGDVAMWDNRQTQHSVVGDFGEAERVIQRVTLRGEEPRR
jgi:alpha-ketoglutarate-dependent taurine dioxygenase